MDAIFFCLIPLKGSFLKRSAEKDRADGPTLDPRVTPHKREESERGKVKAGLVVRYFAVFILP